MCSKSGPRREVYSITDLTLETRKISNQQPNLTPEELEEKEYMKTKASRRKKIIKIRAETNDLETKRNHRTDR